MRTFLLCLLLLLGQCPGLGLAGPVPGLPLRTKPLEKSALPSQPDQSIDLYVSAGSVLSMVRKVRILRGGVVSWALNKGPIHEDSSAMPKNNGVPPKPFGLIQISSDHVRTFNWIS
jgi:hypothetical protein